MASLNLSKQKCTEANKAIGMVDLPDDVREEFMALAYSFPVNESFSHATIRTNSAAKLISNYLKDLKDDSIVSLVLDPQVRLDEASFPTPEFTYHYLLKLNLSLLKPVHDTRSTVVILKENIDYDLKSIMKDELPYSTVNSLFLRFHGNKRGGIRIFSSGINRDGLGYSAYMRILNSVLLKYIQGMYSFETTVDFSYDPLLIKTQIVMK